MLDKLPNELTADEKISVFGHRYMDSNPVPKENNIDIENDKKQINTPLYIPEISPEVQEMLDIDFGEDIPEKEKIMFQKELNNSKKQNYFQNVDKNLPDPQTMTRNFFRRNKQVRQSTITQEIDALDLDIEDKNYLKLLQQVESNGNSKIVNRFGYAGLYQFGNSALKTVNMSKEDYMQNTINQHIAALKLKQNNLKQLRQFIGKQINGITLTEQNLAAGQHLIGAQGVKKYIESDGKNIPVDGNNIPVITYLFLFSKI